MIPGLRRLLAVVAIGVALLIGAPSVFAAAAPSPSPTAPATGKATGSANPTGASATAGVDPDDDDGSDDTTPDTAPDNSRTLWLLGGVGVVAVGAAAIVIARR